MVTMGRPDSVLITGASSGIGAALANTYAANGTTLFLGGRDIRRLEAVANECRSRGAQVECRTVDVTNGLAMQQWIREADNFLPLDLVVANAGISGGTAKTGREPADQVGHIFAVNIDGMHNTVSPALERMTDVGRTGQIALMSSLASFRGFGGAPAYCASKAAVRVYGEGLRAAHSGTGVRVSVICPGFVRSPMTEGNAFRMPMLMDADRAAAIIRSGLARDRARIAFPLPLYLTALAVQAMPSSWANRLSRALPAKH